MTFYIQRFGIGAVLLVASAGCGGSSASGPPQITLNDPNAGANVMLATDNTAPVKFSALNFALERQGNCGAGECGQVYGNIDGNACNQLGKPYNAISPNAFSASTDTVILDFSLCPVTGAAGNHSIAISLHRDDGATVIGIGNAPARAEISITTSGGSGR
jgi:hypothetical protein